MQVEPGTFEHLARLIYTLGSISPQHHDRPATVFLLFLQALPTPLPARYGTHLFRLLFPYFSPRRRYQMKETVLARRMAYVLGLNRLQAGSLYGWNDGQEGGRGTAGCLGEEIQRVARSMLSIRFTGKVSMITLAQIDQLLDELASHSPFSQLGDVDLPEPRSQSDILYDLFVRSQLSPYAMSVLTQIILNDLRPLLSPLPPEAFNFTTALSTGYKATPQLDIRTAMRLWDKEAPSLNRNWGNLDLVMDEIERREGGAGRRSGIPPSRADSLSDLIRPGINVEIPKCEKGRSLHSALKTIAGPAFDRVKTVWAETKYDGIRLQIHLWQDAAGPPRIRLFSKSKRDSTLDRLACHSIIMSALGLPVDPDLPQHDSMALRAKRLSPQNSKTDSIILEGELLPYNEACRGHGRGPGIEEFWNLSRIRSNEPAHHRHYYLAFFDILYRNGQSLLNTPYSTRRSILQKAVRCIPGFTQLAERHPVDLGHGTAFAEHQLEAIFARSNALIEEGLVLKADMSRYHCSQLRWVKIKRDYIPGMGDCIDLPVIGMGWDKDRARELRVGTSILITFYAAVLANPKEVEMSREEPHFEVLFTSGYGMDRSPLERLNRDIQLGKIPCRRMSAFRGSSTCIPGLSYRISFRDDCAPPVVVFDRPINVEFLGAGYQKLSGSKHFALRWPRVEKVHLDRDWTAALTGPEYLRECWKALGYLGNINSKPTPPNAAASEDSLTAFVDANRTSGTDIVELSPIKQPHSPDIKAETLSPGKPLRLTKSMPEGFYDRLPVMSRFSSRTTLYKEPAADAPRRGGRPAAGKRALIASTGPSDRVLHIKRRCLQKSLSTTADQD